MTAFKLTDEDPQAMGGLAGFAASAGVSQTVERREDQQEKHESDLRGEPQVHRRC
jgi:hypothetical protein